MPDVIPLLVPPDDPGRTEMVQPTVDRQRVVEPFAFTGSGSEYFRIWIVNLVLSIVTLGIYSAWAKVRRVQYFYRHTRVAGSSLQYLGKPGAILKGRIVAAVLFGIYYTAGQASPLFGLAAFGLLALVLPWLLMRSFRFRLHNTSYRGIRFAFRGSARSAYWVFLALPVFSLPTLFALIPFTHQRIKRYQIGESSFGDTPFVFRSKASEFYIAYVAAGFLMFALIVVPIIFVSIARAIGESGDNPLDPAVSFWNTVALMTFITAYATALMAFQAVLTTRIQNDIWSNTMLGAHGFMCSLRTMPLFRVLLSNLVLTVVTFGLFRPFAQIRLASYVLGELSLVPAGPLEELSAGEDQDHDAFGEEAAEMFDFDIAF